MGFTISYNFQMATLPNDWKLAKQGLGKLQQHLLSQYIYLVSDLITITEPTDFPEVANQPYADWLLNDAIRSRLRSNTLCQVWPQRVAGFVFRVQETCPVWSIGLASYPPEHHDRFPLWHWERWGRTNIMARQHWACCHQTLHSLLQVAHQETEIEAWLEGSWQKAL